MPLPGVAGCAAMSWGDQKNTGFIRHRLGAIPVVALNFCETLFQVLHLNFECEAKWLSCSHI